MRKSYLFYNLALATLFIIAFQSCKKENGIDNDSVIKKPYGLYLGDSQGALLNTNDGVNYKTIFPPDGYPMRAIITSGYNALFIKSNVHLSVNNGGNFDSTYSFTNPFTPWQPMILDVPNHQRVYLISVDPASKGIVLSDDNGKRWVVDTSWDDNTAGGNITSFAQLKSGEALYAHGSIGDSIYKRDNKLDKWTNIVPTTPLPASGIFYLGHYNNTLTATDITGVSGMYGSNNDGKDWFPYFGLPKRVLYATNAPFEQTLLVGTDSMGVYRLQNGVFVPSNNGLENYTTVFAIAGKDDIYKNDATKRYVYIATDKGLYRSEDLGQNWTLVKEGFFKALY